MSTSSFDPVSFLMKISPPMLVEYAKQHDITLNLEDDEDTGEQYATRVLSLIEKESREKQGNFWMDIDDIESMSTKEACEYLTNKLHEKGVPLDEETVEGFKRLNQRAMYFYLHHKDLFYETFDSYSHDVKQGWKGRKTVAVPLNKFIDNKASGLLEVSTLKFRLMLEMNLVNETRIFQLQSEASEIGRMLGGWLKSVQSQ